MPFLVTIHNCRKCKLTLPSQIVPYPPVYSFGDPEGKEIIRLYYDWSPAIVKAMEEDEELKEEVKEMINGILGLIEEEAE